MYPITSEVSCISVVSTDCLDLRKIGFRVYGYWMDTRITIQNSFGAQHTQDHHFIWVWLRIITKLMELNSLPSYTVHEGMDSRSVDVSI